MRTWLSVIFLSVMNLASANRDDKSIPCSQLLFPKNKPNFILSKELLLSEKFNFFPKLEASLIKELPYEQLLSISNHKFLPSVESLLSLSNKDLLSNKGKKAAPAKPLPANIPKRFASGFEAMYAFLTDTPQVTVRLKELERDVIEMARQQKISPQAALEAVLSRDEAEGDFGPAIDLEKRFYPETEWKGVLRSGRLFRDPGFEDKLHGAQNHRIQWNLVMREIRDSKKLSRLNSPYGDVAPVEYYKAMGMVAFNAALDWTVTNATPGQESLWYQLFDSNANNATSPEQLTSLMRTSAMFLASAARYSVP